MSAPSSLGWAGRPLVACGLLFCLAGCSQDPRAAHNYHIQLPKDWKDWRWPVPPIVPGRILEAHEIPCGTQSGSLLIFRSGYLPETTVSQLLIATRYLLLNLPTLKIAEAKEFQVGERPAVLVSVTGEGNGRGLSPTGMGKPIHRTDEEVVLTRSIWVRVPRGPEDGTLEVLFACPEAEYSKLAPVWKAALASLRA